MYQRPYVRYHDVFFIYLFFFRVVVQLLPYIVREKAYDSKPRSSSQDTHPPTQPPTRQIGNIKN